MYQLSTAQDLGHLQYVRVWHDSSGRGNWQDWFLTEIGIEDLQTHERFLNLIRSSFTVLYHNKTRSAVYHTYLAEMSIINIKFSIRPGVLLFTLY